MKKETLALLLGYIANQEKEIDRLFEVIKCTEPTNNEKVVYLGYYLHNIYCAFEDMFKETVKAFENRIDDPSKYHRELLKRMVIEVPGIRPQFLSRASAEALDELRSFRHMFRHSYMYKLDAERVKALKEKLLRSIVIVKSDIDRFTQFLRGKIDTSTEKRDGSTYF